MALNLHPKFKDPDAHHLSASNGRQALPPGLDTHRRISTACLPAKTQDTPTAIRMQHNCVCTSACATDAHARMLACLHHQQCCVGGGEVQASCLLIPTRTRNKHVHKAQTLPFTNKAGHQPLRALHIMSRRSLPLREVSCSNDMLHQGLEPSQLECLIRHAEALTILKR